MTNELEGSISEYKKEDLIEVPNNLRTFEEFEAWLKSTIIEVETYTDEELRENHLGGHISKEGHGILLGKNKSKGGKHVYPHWYKGFK